MSVTIAATEERAALEKIAQGVARLASSAPEVDLTADERVRRAKRVFIEKTDARVALDLESCLHCGMCAEACHFYEGTGQGRYAPIHKLKLLRKVYRRELGPFRFIQKLLTRDLTVAELEQWQELVFDSCTECGRCDMICPVGVHLSRGVHITRQALTAAGLAPAELRALDAEQKSTGAILGAGVERLRGALEELRSQGIEAPLDKPQAEYLLLSPTDPKAAVALVESKAKADPKGPYRRMLIEVLRQQRDYARADKLLRELVQESPPASRSGRRCG